MSSRKGDQSSNPAPSPPPYPPYPPPYPPPPIPPPYPYTQTITATVTTGPAVPSSSVSNPITSVTTHTVITTSNGLIITIINASTTVIPGGATLGAAASSSGSSSHKSHAALIGGVVGGIVALTAFVFLLYFYLFRCRRRKGSTDGDSRIDMVASGNRVNLAEETASPLVTPFQYESSSSSTSDSTRRYQGPGPSITVGGTDNANGVPRSPSHSSPPESTYSSEYTDISSVVFSPTGQASDPGTDGGSRSGGNGTSSRGRMSWTPLLVTTNHGSSSPYFGVTGGVRSTKEREARSRYTGGLGLATPLEGDEPGDLDGPQQYPTPRAQPSPSPPRSPIIVHQDAGRVDSLHPDKQPEEIPPTYHSIAE